MFDWLEMCEKAQCSPDSAHLAVGKRDEGAWMSALLSKRGVLVTTDQAQRAADAWWAEVHQCHSIDLGSITI